MEPFCFSIYMIKSDLNKILLLFVILSYKDSLFISLDKYVRENLFFHVRKASHLWNYYDIDYLDPQMNVCFLKEIQLHYYITYLFMKYSVTLISVCDTLRQLTLLPKKMRNEPSFQVFLMIIICKIKIEKLEKTVVWSLTVTVGKT